VRGSWPARGAQKLALEQAQHRCGWACPFESPSRGLAWREPAPPISRNPMTLHRPEPALSNLRTSAVKAVGARPGKWPFGMGREDSEVGITAAKRTSGSAAMNSKTSLAAHHDDDQVQLAIPAGGPLEDQVECLRGDARKNPMCRLGRDTPRVRRWCGARGSLEGLPASRRLIQQAHSTGLPPATRIR